MSTQDLDEQAAYEAALRLIAYRDRTVHEVRKRLAEERSCTKTVESAVARLTQMHPG